MPVLIAFFCWGIAATPLAARLVDLRPYLSPVKFQGKRNTCSVFAATALLEYLIRRKTGQQLDLSEAYNYYAGKRYALTTAFLKRGYGHIDGLAGFLAVLACEQGCMLEKDWPYRKYNWLQLKDPRCRMVDGKYHYTCFTGLPPRGAKILPWALKPVFVARNRLGSFLLKYKRPIVFNVDWYNSSVNHKTGRLSLPDPNNPGKRYGHVILLVGYDTKTRLFLFRNSWGPRWGMKGYGIVPEQYLLRHYEARRMESGMASYSADRRRFIRRAGMGCSATLVRLTR